MFTKLRIAALAVLLLLAGCEGKEGTDGETGPPGSQGPVGPSTGAAGGDLAGSYPDPVIAAGVVTLEKLDPFLVDGAAGEPSVRTLGTGANQAAAGDDGRLSDARTPTGAASGDLTGNYPFPALANGAVTASKISSALFDAAPGIASLRSIGPGAAQCVAGDDFRLDLQVLSYIPSNGRLLISNGNEVTIPGFRRTVIVSPGPNPAESGTYLQSAMGSVVASAEYPSVIKLDPGVYDLGATTLVIPSFVTLEGFGEHSRVLGQNGTAMIDLSSDSEIRDLVLENAATGFALCAGIRALNVDRVRISRTRLAKTGCGTPRGIYLENAGTPLLSGVTVAVSGASTQTFGIVSVGATVASVRDSDVRAALPSQVGLFGSTGGTLRVANTLIDGAAGSSTCVGTFDENYVALDTTCN